MGLTQFSPCKILLCPQHSTAGCLLALPRDTTGCSEEKQPISEPPTHPEGPALGCGYLLTRVLLPGGFHSMNENPARSRVPGVSERTRQWPRSLPPACLSLGAWRGEAVRARISEPPRSKHPLYAHPFASPDRLFTRLYGRTPSALAHQNSGWEGGCPRRCKPGSVWLHSFLLLTPWSGLRGSNGTDQPGSAAIAAQ